MALVRPGCRFLATGIGKLSNTVLQTPLMKTITFIRHGQSVANAGGLTVVHHAIPLSSLGELQARTLSALLPAKPPLILSHPSFVRSKPLLLLSRELG